MITETKTNFKVILLTEEKKLVEQNKKKKCQLMCRCISDYILKEQNNNNKNTDRKQTKRTRKNRIGTQKKVRQVGVLICNRRDKKQLSRLACIDCNSKTLKSKELQPNSTEKRKKKHIKSESTQ